MTGRSPQPDVEAAWQRAAGRAVEVTLLALVDERDALRQAAAQARRGARSGQHQPVTSRPAGRGARLASALYRRLRQPFRRSGATGGGETR